VTGAITAEAGVSGETKITSLGRKLRINVHATAEHPSIDSFADFIKRFERQQFISKITQDEFSPK
jgi:hypothetical protein